MHQELIYTLEEKPPFFKSLFCAFAHLLAMLVGVITPALLICKGLGVGSENTARIISASLFASGLASLLQIRSFKGIGSGLLSIQGTSFNFVSPIILGGLTLKNQGIGEVEMLGAIFGTLMLCSLTEVFISQMLPFIKRIISPLVSGVVVLIIGLSLINVGLINAGGGYQAIQNQSFGDFNHLFLAFSVIVLIVFFNIFKNPFIRTSSLFFAMLIGIILAYYFESFSFDFTENLPIVFLPHPLYFGISLDYHLILPLILVFAVTSLETIGDITATSEVSHQPIQGEKYTQRIKGGVLANGINSFFSALLSTFPNSCFGQNNGVIALTGVASRYVGYFVAILLMILGSFPMIANLAIQIPEPILGGATLVMFGTIAATGVRILSKEDLNRRSILIIAISLGIGLGIGNHPEILQFMPTWFKTLFSSGIAGGGLCAIILNLVLPKEGKDKDKNENFLA